MFCTGQPDDDAAQMLERIAVQEKVMERKVMITMKRRQFLKAVAVVAVATVASSEAVAETPKAMKHLYDNGEGELVAANTVEDAAHYLDVELGGHDEAEAKELLSEWLQIDDGAKVPIIDCDNYKAPPTVKTAREWAAGFDHVEMAASTYW